MDVCIHEIVVYSYSDRIQSIGIHMYTPLIFGVLRNSYSSIVIQTLLQTLAGVVRRTKIGFFDTYTPYGGETY